MPANVGIIGGGIVGMTLGKQLLKQGRPIVYGSRDPSKLQKELSTKGIAAEALPVKDAVKNAEVVIVAVPGWRDAAGATAIAESFGDGANGKVVVDVTNPLTAFPGLEVLWSDTSGGELLAASLPSARVYKTFNTVGTSVMEAVDDMGFSVDMMFAGPDDAEAKATMEALIKDAGFSPVYIGPIRYARNLEAIGELWIHLGVPPAGFTKESFGNLFSFQLQRKKT